VSEYAEFLATKAQHGTGVGFEPLWMPDVMFGFQAFLTEWAIRQGRGAILADCGLGKALMSLVWAENVKRYTGKPVLLPAPLAVSFQLEEEAEKFGIDAAVSRDGSIPAGITITNYERLEKFDTYKFGGVACDESSAIKAFDGQRRAIVTEFMRQHQYRLLGTATAAPNDYTELGTSSEALGYLGLMDMLGRFFVNKQKTADTKGRWRGHAGPRIWEGQQWRFKGHAEDAFWRWVASWARACRKPSDLGFEDDGFILPPLEYRHHVVEARTLREGELFNLSANGLHEEREEARRTIQERCERAAELLADADPGVMWCQLNDEGDLLTKLIDGAVQVSGSDSVDAKEEKLAAFGRGEIRVLVTKPKIGAWGLNWQHCHRVCYLPSHSYEQWYQAIRRCWRFGQKETVTVDVVTSEGGANMLANLEYKAAAADRMFDSLTAHMRDALNIARSETYDTPVQVPSWV
jgi:hypothetical protein